MGRVSTCNSVYTEFGGGRGGTEWRNLNGERERERGRERAGRIDSGQHPIKDKDAVETVYLARLPRYTETLLLQFHANRELDYRMGNLSFLVRLIMPIFKRVGRIRGTIDTSFLFSLFLSFSFFFLSFFLRLRSLVSKEIQFLRYLTMNRLDPFRAWRFTESKLNFQVIHGFKLMYSL